MTISPTSYAAKSNQKRLNTFKQEKKVEVNVEEPEEQEIEEVNEEHQEHLDF